MNATPPRLGEMIRDWVFTRYGRLGLAGLALISLALAAYWNWDKVSKLPAVKPVLGHFSRGAIPKADPDRFSILVAHLENDTNRDQERLIVEGLKEIRGIQVLTLDRTIPLEGSVPEHQEEQGHTSARDYLKQSGASVLIWGMVLTLDGKTIPKLYWTASRGPQRNPRRYDSALSEAQLRLPVVFWSDLADILRLLVATHRAEFMAGKGHYVDDRLPQFIAKVRNFLQATEDHPTWGLAWLGETRLIFANALTLLGEQTGNTKALEEAVTAYRETLRVWPPDRLPLQRAAIQNNLGNALFRIGELETGTHRLEEAATVYRDALKEWTRDRVPLHWATAQNNLGAALVRLSEREPSTRTLEEAVAAHREALKEWTRDRVPLDWATAQSNLGNALSALGEREGGTRRLEEAVTAYREALKEWTRDRVPLDWAGAQSNLGNTLSVLGEREGGTRRLEEAVTACREALKEWTRDRVPLRWAIANNNLGVALRMLGRRASDTRLLEEAVTAHREALKEWTRDRVPLDWARSQNNLGKSLWIIGQRESATVSLEGAIAAFGSALEILDTLPNPCYARAVRANLQQVQAVLEERRKGSTKELLTANVLALGESRSLPFSSSSQSRTGCGEWKN